MQFLERARRLIGWRLAGPRAAPLVVLAHPLGMSQGVWDEVIDALTPHYRVLSWDLPGHGASDPLHEAITVDSLVDDLLALVEQTGQQRFHFVGTSIGGVIGQQLLCQHPDRLKAVVLTNTGVTIGTPERWHQRARRVRDEGLGAMAAELAPNWFSPKTRDNTALVAGWTAQLARCDDESYARLCELLAEVDFTNRLPRFDALPGRIRVLGGSADGSTPPETITTLAGQLGGAPLELFEQVGHAPSVEASAQLIGRLRHWLVASPSEPGQHGVSFDEGVEVRKRVLGSEHVEHSLASATTLDAPFQQLISRTAWGELWGNATFSVTQRSLITLAILAALGRDGELALHLKTAHRTGVTEEELRQALLHVATYAGVPAANHAFAMARSHGWGDTPMPLDDAHRQ